MPSRGVTVHVFVLNRFGTGCSVRNGGVPNKFPHGQSDILSSAPHVATAHVHTETTTEQQPGYYRLHASYYDMQKPELEDPPASLRSPVWEHFGFPVRYKNGGREVDKTNNNKFPGVLLLLILQLLLRPCYSGLQRP